MRRFALTLAIISACLGALGQGKVTFGNDSNHLFVLGVPLSGDPNGPIPVSPLPSGLSLVAILYAGTSAGTMTLQKYYVLDATNWGPTPGRMVNRPVILTNVPGGALAYFQIIVTDTGAVLPATIGGGPLYFTGQTYFGTSGLFTAIPGSSLSYPNLANGASSTWAAGPLDAGGCLSCPPLWMYVGVFLPSAAVYLGGDVTFYGQPYPYPNLRFQWYKDFLPIAGATNQNLILTNVTLSDSGSYILNANDGYHFGSSDPATLTVFIPAIAATLDSPTNTTDHQFQFTVTGTAGSNYIVQVATNLSATTDWVSLFTNAAPFIFVDSNAYSFSRRFYRAHAP